MNKPNGATKPTASTRRATLRGHEPGFSSAGGQASLHTLFEAEDFSLSTFLLSVLSEGTFVNLLNFLHEHARDPVTCQIATLAARDEARDVAFGTGHLEHRLQAQPETRLRSAVEQRYDELAATTGLNDEVFDALVLLAAGASESAAVARGHAAVQTLKLDMAVGRKSRLARLGFSSGEAERLSEMHTRNFMCAMNKAQRPCAHLRDERHPPLDRHPRPLQSMPPQEASEHRATCGRCIEGPRERSLTNCWRTSPA